MNHRQSVLREVLIEGLVILAWITTVLLIGAAFTEPESIGRGAAAGAAVGGLVLGGAVHLYHKEVSG